MSEVVGTGTLEAKVSATISPEITGRIISIAADEGDRVSRGQTLVNLQDEPLQHQVNIAQAEVAAADAAIERLKAEKERAQAVLDQAQREHHRIQSLVTRSSASTVEMDRASEALRVAEADLDRADSAIREAQRKLIAANKTLEYRRAMLADASIEAPFDGLVVDRARDPGDVVVPGSPVLKLVSTDEMWIGAWVGETEMAQLHPNQPARVVFRAEPDRAYRGRVVRLGKETDRQTREFLVDVEVLELPVNWAVGQRAEVYIETARKDQATVVPARFIRWRDGQAGTFTNQNGRAHWQTLRLGLWGREQVEVLQGLQPQDQIITPTSRDAMLEPGERVVVR